MRRVLYLIVIALVAFGLWQWQSAGLRFDSWIGEGGTAGPDRSVPGGAGEASELRIEIIETAAESEAHYRMILERFGEDPEAKAWVADCVTQAAGQGRAEFSESWEYACWRSWEELQN